MPLAQATDQPEPSGRKAVVFSGPAMGTRYSVSAVLPDTEEARECVQSAIDAELALVDRLFSRWNPESELSRFNARQSTDPTQVSAEMLEVLRIAEQVNALTSGAFDVTVAPLVEVWGFGPGGHREEPSPQALAAARERVGHGLIFADPVRGTLVKTRPDVTLDMNGLVAGWVADRIAAAIAKLGFPDVLVDAGGEICARGTRPDGRGWRVAVESPAGGKERRSTVIALDGISVATSGDYRKFWVDEQGRRRSHIIDPRNGEPVTQALAAVTIVHADGAFADAVGTALIVLGPQEARLLAEREKWAVRLVERRSDGTWAEWTSPQFEALVIR